MRGLHLRNLFADDPARGERMTAEAAGVYLDYSKNRINDETLKLLIELAEQSGLRAKIDAMFRGEKINVTAVNTQTRQHQARMAFTLEVESLGQLKRALLLARDIPGVFSADRR